jgi:hypothetical protein
MIMTRPTTTVYRYKVYDVTIDDYRYSTRMATTVHIDKIGEMLPETRFEVFSDLLIDNAYTEKDFTPTPEHGFDPKIGKVR